MSPPPPLRQLGLFLAEAPHSIERARARQKEEHGEDASLGMPAEQPVEVVEDIDGEGEGEPVEVGPALQAASTAMTSIATSSAIEIVRSIATTAPSRFASVW